MFTTQKSLCNSLLGDLYKNLQIIEEEKALSEDGSVKISQEQLSTIFKGEKKMRISPLDGQSVSVPIISDTEKDGIRKIADNLKLKKEEIAAHADRRYCSFEKIKCAHRHDNDCTADGKEYCARWTSCPHKELKIEVSEDKYAAFWQEVCLRMNSKMTAVDTGIMVVEILRRDFVPRT